MNSLALTLGSRIQRLRMRQNRTLQEIADACGFTRSLLSKIEHGKTTPPIATLMKIADALGVDMVDLLSREGEVKPVLTPAAKLADSALTRNEKGYLFHVLAGRRPDKAMQPFLFVARKGEAKPAPLAHRGEEVVYVLEGEMVLRVGSEDYRLGKGDSLYFDAEQTHEVTPVSDKVVYLAVLADAAEAPPAAERRRRG